MSETERRTRSTCANRYLLAILLVAGAALTIAGNCAKASAQEPAATQNPATKASIPAGAKAPNTLAISITDLPAGVNANVTLTGPDGQSTHLTASRSLRLEPGIYSVTAQPVSVGQSAYHATEPMQKVTVGAAGAEVTVDYYDIIPATTRVLDEPGGRSLAIAPGATALTMTPESPIASSLRPGEILASGPTAAAPNGLLVKVVTVSTSGGKVTATVRPASLMEAITRGRFSAQLAFSPESIRNAINQKPGQRTLLLEQAMQEGLKPEAVSAPSQCVSSTPFVQEIDIPLGLGASIGAVGSSGQANLIGLISLAPCMNVNADWSSHHLKSLSAIASFTEKATLTAKVQVTGSLTHTFESPKLLSPDFWVDIGGVPLLVRFTASLVADVNVDGNVNITANASQRATADAGFQYLDGKTTPVNPKASFGVTPGLFKLDGSIDGKIDGGVKLGVEIGVSFVPGWLGDFASITPSIQPDFFYQFTSGRPETDNWGLEASAGAELDLGGEKTLSIETPELTIFDYLIWKDTIPPNPLIHSVTPNTATVAAPSMYLNVTGANFVQDSVVEFNGTPLPTSFLSAGALKAWLPAEQITRPGTFDVSVLDVNSGEVTHWLPFVVNPGTQGVSISPLSVTVPGGQVQTFAAAVSGGGNITWKILEGASGGSITNTGIYTAPPTTGIFHVGAINTDVPSKSAYATVKVTNGVVVATIHSFDRAVDGDLPWGGLIQGASGVFYGTAYAGGDSSCPVQNTGGCGTLYRMNSIGDVTVLHSFSGADGAFPIGHPTLASNGNLYGTTEFGGSNFSGCTISGTSISAGCGTVYKSDEFGDLTRIYSFTSFDTSSGVAPWAALVQGSDGNLYGTASEGSDTSCGYSMNFFSRSGCGSVFTIDPSNNLTVLHSFDGNDGAYPQAALMQASDGTFWGMTVGGGDSSCSALMSPGCGSIYEMDKGGNIDASYQLEKADGTASESPMIQSRDGDLYGVGQFAGTGPCGGNASVSGCGTVFKTDLAGNITVLHNFSGPDGAYPTGIIQAKDGFFYGTTDSGGDMSCSGEYGPGCGTVFRMDSAGNITVLYAFTGAPDGRSPESGVIQGIDGNLYGTTAGGGANSNGAAFRISNLRTLSSAALPEPSPEKQELRPRTIPEMKPQAVPMLVGPSN